MSQGEPRRRPALAVVAATLAVFLLPGGQRVLADPASRPRVGLALGGGAARAIAHAGVLLWLEENRIPVDYVAGTSLGGLIGGGYATGMSAAEIRDLLLEADWDRLFESDVPYPQRTFRRKQDRRQYPVDVELGLRGGLSLPSGLSSGHQIGLLLSRIAFPHAARESFDDLPIPFRCVAVDIERGEALALHEGSLVQALRATMAIPGVFAPSRYQGRLLVDGGVLKNVPADVARAMGADVVVAVSVGENLHQPTSLSMTGLVNRSVVVMMDSATRRTLKDADLVLEPQLEGFDSLDFRRAAELIRRGYQAAAAASQQLLPLRLDQAAWLQHLAARRARRPAPLEEPVFVSVEGIPSPQAEALGPSLTRSLTVPLDADRLEDRLTRIIGSGRYESATYEATEAGGRPGLLVRFQEKAHAPPFVDFSLDLATEPGAVVIDLGARVTVTDLVGVGSELRVDLAAGSSRGVATELYRPVGRPRFFLAPRVFFDETSQNLFHDDALVATYRTRRTGAGVDVGIGPGRHFELRAGFETSHVDADVRVGNPVLGEPHGREDRFLARLDIDKMRTPILPEAGFRLEAQASFYTRAPEAERAFPLLAGTMVAATSVRGGTALRESPPPIYRFTLGGPFRLGAFAPDTFRGRHFVYAHLGYLLSVGRLPDLLGGPVRLAAQVELGSAFDHASAARLEGCLTTGVALDTFLGPIFAGASLGNRGAFGVYVSVGRLLR